LATKSTKTLARQPVTETISQTEPKPPTAALLRIASLAEYEPLPTRWSRIVPGVIAVFALLIGANYWVSQRGRASVAAQVPRPTDTPRAAVEPPPMDRPAPQLSFGLWLSSSQPEPENVRASTATQPQISALDQLPESAPGRLPQSTLGREPRYITVSEGQSLIRIAHANHVSAKAIAAANHLEPPYRLKIGSQLLMPDPGFE
jgi:hypothetical protein